MSERPVVPVVVFPGSNDDRDAARALERLGAEAPRVWHTDEALPTATAAVVLPGGFSYGDYLRCGAIARFSPIMAAVTQLRERRRPRARHLQRLPDPHRGRPAPRRAPPERVALVRLPRRAARRRGRGDAVHLALRARRRSCRSRSSTATAAGSPTPSCSPSSSEAGQIALRYAPGANPNGAVADVAGVTNADGNVFGLMPHPEHAVDPLLGSTDGALILGSLVDAARLSLAAAV